MSRSKQAIAAREREAKELKAIVQTEQGDHEAGDTGITASQDKFVTLMAELRQLKNELLQPAPAVAGSSKSAKAPKQPRSTKRSRAAARTHGDNRSNAPVLAAASDSGIAKRRAQHPGASQKQLAAMAYDELISQGSRAAVGGIDNHSGTVVINNMRNAPQPPMFQQGGYFQPPPTPGPSNWIPIQNAQPQHGIAHHIPMNSVEYAENQQFAPAAGPMPIWHQQNGAGFPAALPAYPVGQAFMGGNFGGPVQPPVQGMGMYGSMGGPFYVADPQMLAQARGAMIVDGAGNRGVGGAEMQGEMGLLPDLASLEDLQMQAQAEGAVVSDGEGDWGLSDDEMQAAMAGQSSRPNFGMPAHDGGAVGGNVEDVAGQQGLPGPQMPAYNEGGMMGDVEDYGWVDELDFEL